MGLRKQVVLDQVQDLDWKNSCRAVTPGPLPAFNRVLDVITAVTGALPAQDGVTLVDGDSVLLDDQTDPIDNGIYVVTQAADPFVLTRRDDFNDNSNVTAGAKIPIEEGILFKRTTFELLTTGTILINTTPIDFDVEIGTSAVTVTTAPLDLYLRDVDGSDANDGLTTGTPLKTMAALLTKIPDIIRHAVRVHMAVHGGIGYPFPLLGIKHYEEVLYFTGDGAGDGTDGLIEVIASTVSTAGSDKTKVVVAGAGWTVDQFKGAWVEFLDGDAIGYFQQINGNSSDTLLFASDTDAAEATNGAKVNLVGDAFRIVTPAVVWETGIGGTAVKDEILTLAAGSSTGFGKTNFAPGGVVYSKLRWEGADFQHSLEWRDIDVALFGVEWDQPSGAGDKATGFSWANCNVFYGCDSFTGRLSRVAALGAGAVDQFAWTGMGLTFLDTAGKRGPFGGGGGKLSNINGYFVSNRGAGGTVVAWRHRGNIFGGRLQAIFVEGTGVFCSLGISTAVSNPIVMRPLTNDPCIFASGGGGVTALGIDLASIDGDCLKASLHSTILEFLCTGQPTGTGRAGFAESHGKIVTFGGPALGDASNDDWVVEGELPFNKSDLGAVNDGVTNVGGASITREFS